MVVRDTLDRIVVRQEQGRCVYRIRRMKCTQCGRIHRELPDFVLPFKNYDAHTVQKTLDSDSDNDCCADNSTMGRWRSSFAMAQNTIAALLMSYFMTLTQSAGSIFKLENILLKIKREQKGWLSFVLRLLINSGHRPHTGFAFCP
jgi:hypothetical protein